MGTSADPNSVEFAPAQASEVARYLDDRHLHAEANAEIRDPALAGKFGCCDLAGRASLAEATGDNNAVNVLKERRGVFALEHLRFDPLDVHMHPVGDAAMNESFHQRFVGVAQLGVFADDGDGDVAVRVRDVVRHAVPSGDRSGAGAPSMPKAPSTALSNPSL